MSNQHQFIALNRFGLGTNPEKDKLPEAGNVRQWLIDQLSPLQFSSTIATTGDVLATFREFQAAKKLPKQQTAANDKKAAMVAVKQHRKQLVHTARALTVDTLTHAINTAYGFQARLLDFFSNHFSVSGNNLRMRAMAPLLEREAIAPHLGHDFADMLIAVEQHPAMLVYLNNEQSIGPGSVVGQRRKKGLNENLAREILELHTLGVTGGYTQTDVRELAMAITGWSVSAGKDRQPGTGFSFRDKAHEPGTRTVMGKRYPQTGVQQGERILRALAVHPSTAHYLSEKLARHCIADKPDTSLVTAMQSQWLATKGNLQAVLTTMIDHPASWQPGPQKYKTPREFLVSSLRACSFDKLKPRELLNSLTLLGQAPFAAGSPAGYGDTTSDWDGPEALIVRIEWADQLSERVSKDVLVLAEQILGTQLSERTRRFIQRAESRQQALALLLMSPEFQRR